MRAVRSASRRRMPCGGACWMGRSRRACDSTGGIGIAISTGDYTQMGTINRLVNQTETI